MISPQATLNLFLFGGVYYNPSKDQYELRYGDKVLGAVSGSVPGKIRHEMINKIWREILGLSANRQQPEMNRFNSLKIKG